MLLTLQERFVLLPLLPKEGSFVTLKLIRELQGALAPSEEEIKAFAIVQTDAQVRWDPSLVKDKEVEIGETMTGLMRDTLVRLDEAKSLRLEHMSLYEKFTLPVEG
ncbi:MAG: hypothetical protein V3V96_14465 [Acidiferrobacterales bacterium]